jgi:Flp pilus assembly pilin Flp
MTPSYPAPVPVPVPVPDSPLAPVAVRRMALRFAASDHGAASVDWVILAAVLMGIALAVMTGIQQGTISLGTQVGDRLDATQPGAERSLHCDDPSASADRPADCVNGPTPPGR